MVHLSGMYATLGIMSSSLPVKVWCSKDETSAAGAIDKRSFYLYSRVDDAEEVTGFPSMIEGAVEAVASQYFGTNVVFDRLITPNAKGKDFYKWRITELGKAASAKVEKALKKAHLALKYGLTPQQLGDVFPFHIVFDMSLKIIQSGEQCIRHIPATVAGSNITDIFDLNIDGERHSPTWEDIQAKLNNGEDDSTLRNIIHDVCLSTTVQQTPAGYSFGLIGELTFSTDNNIAVFLCYPNVSSLARLEDLGVTIQDLAKSDKLQLQKDALSETMQGINIMTAARAKYAVRQLKQALTSAQDKLVTKQSFVRYVSHEIRTPLMVVDIGLQMLANNMRDVLKLHEQEATAARGQEDVPVSKDTSRTQSSTIINEALDTIKECKTSMEVSIGILNDLLSYEKIESGIFQLHQTLVLTHLFLKGTIREFRLQVRTTECHHTHVYTRIQNKQT